MANWNWNGNHMNHRNWIHKLYVVLVLLLVVVLLDVNVKVVIAASKLKSHMRISRIIWIKYD